MLKMWTMLMMDDPKRGELHETTVTGPEKVFQLMRRFASLDRECIWRMDLNTRNNVIALELVSVGTLNMALFHPREFFKGAILNNVASVIVIHNHPSGVAEPSEEDISLTKKLCRCGSLLDIQIYDHIIIGSTGFKSLKEAGFV